MKISKLIVLFFLVIPFNANAGFLLEPYVAKSLSGDWKTSGSKEDASMSVTGVKMGYHSPTGFLVGGDLQLGIGEYDNLVAGLASSDAAQVAISGFVGYQTAMGLRGYIHYFFSSAVVADDILAELELRGKGFKFGVGYSVLPWLAVNLEYHMMTYDEYKNTTTTNFASLDPKMKNNFVMVGVSFPFNIGGSSY